MRWRRTAAFALVASVAGGLPAARAEGPDLPALQAQLAAVTRHAEQLAEALEQARARDGGLRRAVEDLAQAHEVAAARLDARVREVYIASGPHRLVGWAELTDPGRAVQLALGRAGGVRVERELVDAVARQSAAARQLRADADRFRADLQAQAAAVLEDQDRARDLLADAEIVVREQQRRAAEQATQEAARRAAAEAARVAAARTALDAVSAAVTRALAPATTDRGRRAGTAAAPVLALLAAAGSGYPRGYSTTGTVITGTASWYGPGFVGSPTASGAPYDPEQQTCAHQALPFGTVLHLRANGRSTNCLVTDRGPYVGDRMLDLSRAGSRALGYSGTAEVTAEVLTTAEGQTSSPRR
ncbi:MAG TPA: RlpA-like double-psi beta-barrel domain-containing protein [Mycobacteriales bacterium]|jgi:rare lipoprotein A|nr:RlpA-like double-psi beta-barrel domain-containing protein [Mycobacteriales bacterium]